ncbi:dihydroxyacid dehydratase [Fusarium acutatum]|uniref:Dihydroxyacid dehydratase n=1 Tax=Fusarium acutatum TaxID=78861 RepID=A0A8H4JJU2_9HYPO|nr:dihydroxyacid dehydratase [Fusarium acutatum]
MSDPPQIHDLMIVFDAVTGGTVGVTALKQAIPDIINFMALADCFERIGVLAYRNYACTAAEKVIEWSGWYYPSCDPSPPSTDDILKFVQDLEMPDDSDYNSNCVSKTALAKACQEMRTNGTIILLYNHAPPMLEHIGGHHYDSEQMSLAFGYGETGELFGNWINGTNVLAGVTLVDKRAVVISFSLMSADNLSDDISENISDWSPYLYLSAMTGGELYRTTYSGRVISRLTICLLLTWMQADGNIDIPQSFRITYKQDPTQFCMVSEANIEMFCGLDCGNLDNFDTLTVPRSSVRVPYGDINNNNQQLSKFTSRYFARSYINCSEYSKNVIAKHIDRIIRTNVSVIAIHPLFGRLWVAVCRDRTGNRIKRTLLERFRAQVCQISDAEDKRQTQTWLEKSYTFFHEISEEIQMQAEVNLRDNILPQKTKYCGYCFEEKSILKSVCTNSSCVVEVCTDCANKWSSERNPPCIFCHSPVFYSDMPTD